MEISRTLSAPSGGATQAEYRDLLEELGTLAGEYRFGVAPNPCVGAAVLSAGVEIGRGFHERWGGAHAEVNALAAAERSGVPKERWDTLVVTLEPCSTQGKTPACVEAILRSGIRRVVVGELDPDARHRGAGLRLLHDQGCEINRMEGPARLMRVAPHFLRWTDRDRLRRPKPWVIAKWAQTRSGQLTPPVEFGDGRWISGPLSLANVQILRGRVDAILTGSGTVLADDPRLTVRPPGDLTQRPLRVVLDSKLRTSAQARLFALESEAESVGDVLICTLPGTNIHLRRLLESAGARLEELRVGDDGRPSLRELMALLWREGHRRILLEAGPTLLQACFEAELIDQLMVYTGAVMGGRGPTLARCLDPRFLLQPRHGHIGEDDLLEAFLVR